MIAIVILSKSYVMMCLIKEYSEPMNTGLVIPMSK